MKRSCSLNSEFEVSKFFAVQIYGPCYKVLVLKMMQYASNNEHSDEDASSIDHARAFTAGTHKVGTLEMVQILGF